MVKEKEVPLKIEVFSNNEDSEYLIHSKIEIQNILRTIFERGTRAALYYNEGNSFVLTITKVTYAIRCYYVVRFP